MVSEISETHRTTPASQLTSSYLKDLVVQLHYSHWSSLCPVLNALSLDSKKFASNPLVICLDARFCKHLQAQFYISISTLYIANATANTLLQQSNTTAVIDKAHINYKDTVQLFMSHIQPYSTHHNQLSSYNNTYQYIVCMT